MSGTVKLIGSADQHWDDTLENADHSIETRLLGKEDVYWDSEGTDEQGSFVDRTGTDRPITLINASHIPLPIAAREACNGAENVSEGMIKLSQMAGTGGGSGAMTEDKTVVLSASLTHIQKQALINSQTKNLGGHTLTLSFPEAIDISFSDCLKFFGFYNGYLVIDLNSITISDNINITKLFYIYDCSCKVEVKDGTLQHTVSQYAIYAERCPGVYLTDMIFIGAGGLTNYAFGGLDCDGYASGCTYSNDNQVTLSGFGSSDASSKASSEASSAVSTHNASGTAHATLFAGKAPVASPTFTGTPTAPTAASGTNNTQIATTGFTANAVNAHNASGSAHATLFAGKAPVASPAFTGTPTAPTAASGTNNTQIATTGFTANAVNAHDASATAHNGFFAPLASPTFTGTPTAPTPAQGDNSMRVATTAFVATAVDATPGIIDRDVARHNASATAHSGILAPLGSPAFTGTPTAPTAASGTNNTQIATTGFTANAVSTHNASGTAHATLFAGKAPVASPVFTGTPEVPTAVNGTNSNQAASTKFVQNAIENSSKIGEVADAKVSTHNTSSTAHQTLFNSKAAANHTHTPQAVGADPSGSASSAVSTHNSANDAHASLFAGKSNVGHTHAAAEANADPAGSASSAVSTHNSAVDAHALLFEWFIPAGTIFPFAGNGDVPSLFLLCDGRAVSRETYIRLFNVIGTLYGAGDGSTTFNVPDFRGAFLRGYLSGTSAAIGTKQAEGLPNIASNGYIATENKNSLNPASALYQCGTIANSRCGDQDYNGPAVAFDASKYNGIYGASTHVTPVNYAVQYIIKY